MKLFNKLLLLLTMSILVISCGGRAQKEANYNTIPLPSEIFLSEGNSFKLSSSTKIVNTEDNEKMKRNAEFLSDFISLSVGIKPSIISNADITNTIVLSSNLVSDNSDAYQIVVNENNIHINGASEAGVFYGIQTLRKSIPLGSVDVLFPNVTINDEPRFGYRGMMLDIARHFEPVEFVKKYIDLIALHNINVFHWHLTDDQGWRIEIKKYPKLTEIGSVRKETVIGKNTGKYDGIPHGGYYTQEEIKDVVKYAADRYITVIPEVDLPGHMLAALTAYPEYGCTGGPYEVEGQWGVFDDVLCPGKEETFEFIENVLVEVMELFPSEYVHIGGDECPKVRWEECDDCQARIKELGLKDGTHAKEFYLQSYVTARVEKFLNEHGRSIIGWDEILEGELAPNATVMSWRGVEGGIEAAQLGHDVIMSPNTYNYFDYYQTQYIEAEPFLQIGGFLPLDRVYSFEPAPETLTDNQKSHIIGVQANLWAEYLKTPDQIEYMVLPRMAALSEVQWMQSDKKDYDEFLLRLPRLMSLYNQLGYNYATHVFDVNSVLTPNFETNSLDVILSTIDNSPIYYTLDGSEPNESSTKYEGMISIKDDAQIKAVSIREGAKVSKVYSENIVVNKSTFKPAKLLTNAAKAYEFNGADLLVDGVFGSSVNYKTGRWIGFQSDDLVVVIDMLEPTEVSEASIRTAVVTGDWIYDASEVIVESSNDDISYSQVAKKSIVDDRTDHWEDIMSHKVDFDATTSRYFKITVKPGIMPEWHPGKGRRAFIFVDEVVLN